jgi:hypothetical protein
MHRISAINEYQGFNHILFDVSMALVQFFKHSYDTLLLTLTYSSVIFNAQLHAL